jgi:hypothetical protein
MLHIANSLCELVPMSFEKIGPYGVSRMDQFVCVPVISLLMLSTGKRLQYWTLYVGLPLLAAMLAMDDDSGFVAAMAFFAWVLIIFSPALRPRTNGLVMSLHADGIEVASDKMTTIYRWNTIGAVRQFRSRQLIMVTPKCALVVPMAATNDQNLARLVSTIAERKAVA